MKTFLIVLLTVMLVKVQSQSIGGVLTGNATVCATNHAGTLSVTGYSGSIQRWEFAHQPNGPWSVMAHTLSVYAYNNLSQHTWFRVVVQNNPYAPAYSNSVLVNVVSPTVFVAVASATHVCEGAAVSVSLQNVSNNLIAWHTSTNNWISTNTSTYSGTTYTLLPNVSTHVRASIQQAPCATATTNAVSLNVSPTPSVGQLIGSATICSNQPSTLSVNGYTGQILQWEQATSSSNPYQALIGTSGLTNLTMTLNSGTCFRVKVGNSVCNAVYSNVHCVAIESPALGGLITGTTAICVNATPSTLFLSNFIGTILHWEKKFLSASTWTPINTTQSFLSVVGTTPSSVYRAVLGGSVCPTVYSNSHTVNVLPLPNVSALLANVCEGAIVQPTNTSSGALSFQWRLDNGMSYLGHSPQIVLPNPGTRTVTIIGTSGAGCMDSTSITFSVYPKPLVAFSGLDTTCVNSSVLHQNTSTLTGSSLLTAWFHFGDGTSTTNWPAIHAYSTAGIYFRKCIIQTIQGCKDSASRPIVVKGLTVPQISINGQCTGSPIQFTQSTSNFSSLTWQFGDGNYSTVATPIHQYSVSGQYTVGVQLSDPHCTVSSFTTLQVHALPSVTVTPVKGCEGDSLKFKAQVFPIQASIKWLTGDGWVGNDSVFYHPYSQSGYYPVSYTCQTVSSCSVSNVLTATVQALPVIDWRAKDFCVNDSLLLAVSGELNQVSWQWNNSPAYVANYSWYKSFQTGKQKVQVEVKNKEGCVRKLLDSLLVKPLPDVVLSYSSVCIGDTFKIVNYSDSVSGMKLTYTWLFGDGWYSQVTHPKRVLPRGDGTFSLVTRSENGCYREHIGAYKVFDTPKASFKINHVCVGDSIQVINNSNGAHFIDSYTWKLDDKIYSQQYAPYFFGFDSSIHAVVLKIADINGCVDSTQETWKINLPQVIEFPRDTLVSRGSRVHYQLSKVTQSFWFPSFYFPNASDSQQQWIPESSGCYTVEVKDQLGCEHAHSFCITVNNDYSVKPYELVTADGNQLNDYWYIEHIEQYPDNKVVLLDQWGREVYSEEGYRNTWDGRNYKGELLPEGTYYYYLSFKGSSKVYRGYVVLVR